MGLITNLIGNYAQSKAQERLQAARDIQSQIQDYGVLINLSNNPQKRQEYAQKIQDLVEKHGGPEAKKHGSQIGSILSTLAGTVGEAAGIPRKQPQFRPATQDTSVPFMLTPEQEAGQAYKEWQLGAPLRQGQAAEQQKQTLDLYRKEGEVGEEQRVTNVEAERQRQLNDFARRIPGMKAAGYSDREIQQQWLQIMGGPAKAEPKPVLLTVKDKQTGETFNIYATPDGIDTTRYAIVGKTGTVRAPGENKLSRAFLLSGKAKTPEEADKMSANVEVQKAEKQARDTAGETLSAKDLEPIAQYDAATGHRSYFRGGANQAAYTKALSSELRGNSGLAIESPADYKALTRELGVMRQRLGPIQVNEKMATYNLTKAMELSDQITRGGSSVFNEWLLGAESKFTDDPQLKQFNNYVEAGVNEIAQLISNASGGGVTTDSAKAHAREMLSTRDPQTTFRQAAQALLGEGQQRVDNTQQVIEDTQQKLGALGGGGGAGGGAGTGGGGGGPAAPTTPSAKDPLGILK